MIYKYVYNLNLLQYSYLQSCLYKINNSALQTFNSSPTTKPPINLEIPWSGKILRQHFHPASPITSHRLMATGSKAQWKGNIDRSQNAKRPSSFRATYPPCFHRLPLAPRSIICAVVPEGTSVAVPLRRHRRPPRGMIFRGGWGGEAENEPLMPGSSHRAPRRYRSQLQRRPTIFNPGQPAKNAITFFRRSRLPGPGARAPR